MWGLGFVVVHTRYFGRALEWHSRGQGFDSPYLHQMKRQVPFGNLPFSFFAKILTIRNAYANQKAERVTAK
jgi:hypothetical protein